MVVTAFIALLTAAIMFRSGSALYEGVPDISDDLCPTWFMPTFDGNSIWCTCDGSKVQWGAVVRCPRRSRVCVQNCSSEVKHEKYMYKLNVSIMTGFCMTHNFETHQTLLAACPYGKTFPSNNASDFFVTLPSNLSDLNDFMCGHARREGDLCSRCANGTGPSIAEEGMVCSSKHSPLNWFYFALCELLPPTFFFFVVLFSNVRTMHGPLNAFIFFCQVIASLFVLQTAAFSNAFEILPEDQWNSTSEASRTVLIEAIGFFYTFWNIRFLWTFRFTLGYRMTVIQIKSMQYFSALYPFFLVILTITVIRLYNHFEGSTIVLSLKRPFAYCIHKLHIRTKWSPTEPIIHAFATFILLSYTKMIVVSFALLAPSRVYNQSGELDYKIMPYDASIHFLDRHHLPYAVLALCMLTIFCGLPFLVLLLYPMEWFRKLLRKLKVPATLRRHLGTYTNVYTGCYRFHKDSRKSDCRFFAALYLLFRFLFFFCIFFVTYSYMWLALILLSWAIFFLFSAFKPYKEKWLNIVDSLAFLLASVVIFLYLYQTYIARLSPWLLNSFIALPLLYFVVYVTYEIAKRCCRKLFSRCSNRGDYTRFREDTNRETIIPREGEEECRLLLENNNYKPCQVNPIN